MATQKEAFDFPVDRKKQFIMHEGKKIQSDRDAIFRPDIGKIIGYVSAEEVERFDLEGKKKKVKRDYYQLIEHKEVVYGLRNALDELGMLKGAKQTTYLSGDGARLSHQFDFPKDTAIQPVKGDFITMRLIGYNSLDTSKKVGFELGGDRVICKNGLAVFHKAFFEMSKHSGAFSLDITIDNLKKAIHTFKVKVNSFYKKMATTDISQAEGHEFIDSLMKIKTNGIAEVYGNAVHKVWENPENANAVIPSRTEDGVIIPNSYETIMTSVELDKARTLWTLYNAFTLILTWYVVSLEVRQKLNVLVQKRIAKIM